LNDEHANFFCIGPSLTHFVAVVFVISLLFTSPTLLIRLARENMDVVIVYHANCADGVVSAWICSRYIKERHCVPEVHACCYGEEQVQVDAILQKDPVCVYIVDFSFSKEQLVQLARQCKVTVLDHHVTAKDEISPLIGQSINGVFDIERAACQIAWDYFFPDTQRPWFVDYVADRDLWNWVLPLSNEINAGFTRLEIFPFPNCDEIEKLYHGTISRQNVIDAGRKNLEEIRMILKKLELLKMDVYFEGYFAVFAVCPFGELRSEYASFLLDKYPTYQLALIYDYKPGTSQVNVSLRSRPAEDKPVDVASLAQRYDGGGHKNASGIRLNANCVNRVVQFLQE
jgi:oligoribonuclease NrnB/cAMP/cGMP phosphodiesterase (DHH superfamily)